MTHRELFKQYLSDKKQLIVGAVADPSTLSVTITACDIVELRLDSLGTDTDVVHFSEKCPLPLIVTARGPEEGGQCDWSIEKRIDAYRALLPHAALIDIELHDFDIFDEVIAEAKELGIYVIGSFHNFTTTPPPCHWSKKSTLALTSINSLSWRGPKMISKATLMFLIIFLVILCQSWGWDPSVPLRAP